MNILVVCHYGLYKDLSFSFVHNQIREYVKLGHRVRAIIPIGWGKADRNGKRISKALQITQVDGVELCDLRYLTLGGHGEKGFNTKCAVFAVKTHKRKLFLDFQPDVIHAHTLGFDSDLGAWLKKKFGCPLVVTTHGSDVAGPLSRGDGTWLKERCDRADAIVSVSSALREKVRSCGTATRLEVILNGFVARKPHSEIPRNPCHMIQVCNLIPLKRVDVTIRAFASVKKNHPGMELTVIGQGPQRAMLEELCHQLGVSESVRFLGQLPNPAVFEELSGATYFVMASKPEGFGIVYLEAMAAGCVAIGTEGEGIGDLIKNGENGFLVPADDPEAIVSVIETCLSAPEQAAAIAQKGQAAANKLTWDCNAKQYLELFGEL